MNTIQNFLLRVLGLGKVVDALDGETSHSVLAGLGMILGGVASGALAGSHIVAALSAARGLNGILPIAQGIFAGNVDTAAIGAAWLGITSGWGKIHLRKAIAESAPAAPPAK